MRIKETFFGDFPSFQAYQDAPNGAFVLRQRRETLPRALLLVSVSQTVEQLQDLRDLEEDKEAQVRAQPGDLAMPITTLRHYTFLHILDRLKSKNKEYSMYFQFSVECLAGGDLGFGLGRIQSKVCSPGCRFGCLGLKASSALSALTGNSCCASKQ